MGNAEITLGDGTFDDNYRALHPYEIFMKDMRKQPLTICRGARSATCS